MLRFNFPGDVHSVSFRTDKSQPYFKDERCCEILLEELDFYRHKYGLKIYGYVILPDHVHCLIYFDDDELTISKIIQGIKGATARKIVDLYTQAGSQEHQLLTASPSAEQMLCATPRTTKNHVRNLKYRIWQPSFYDFNIYTDKKFCEKLNYIHKNPIKHGLVNDSSQYKYCSWRNYEQDDQSVFKVDFKI